MKRINKAYVVEKASKKLFIGGGSKWKHLTCQFSGVNKKSGKHCVNTTNKSCKNCQFYDPTIEATIQSFDVLVKEIDDAKKLLTEKTEEVERLANEAQVIRDNALRIKNECEKKNDEILVLNVDPVQIWEHSVNTYGM